MRHLCILIFLVALSCKTTDDCKEKINHLPMYGGFKKCSKQIEADNEFLSYCDKEYKYRTEAAKYYVSRGWDYFYEQKYDTAMFRFNQAWLLDTMNAQIFWGYGNLLGVVHKYKESLSYFDRSLRLDPNNPKVWECAATSYGQYFYETKDVKLLNISIDYLKKSITLDSNNPSVYGQLAASYAYFVQKDSAKKYMKLADKLDPNSVNPEVRQIINNK